MTRVRPFLMFTGQAEEAMRFYVATIPNSSVTDIAHYGAESGDRAGQVSRAAFVLAGQEVICFDSPPVHDFTFTPSISMFVDCVDEAEIDRLYAALSEDGQVMMPLGAYGFSQKFGWTADRFGVSWQLNLP